MSTIGGMNSNSILPYIDYDYLKKNPKILIGYSDTTAILLAVYAKTGIVTYYGPAIAASFGEFPPLVDITYKYFEEMFIRNTKLPLKLQMPEFWTDEFVDWSSQVSAKEIKENKWITIHEGIAAGRLIGGNLDTITGIWGSEYMPTIKYGDILFLEESLKSADEVERNFSLLKINNVFDKVSGIILGKFEKFDNLGTGRKPYEILLEVIGNVNIPILADVDCGHTHPMMVLPIGCRVRLDSSNKSIEIIENYI